MELLKLTLQALQSRRKRKQQAQEASSAISFRGDSSCEAFECIYIRPTNGRATDPVRRSHAVQYVSEPDFPWEKLRAEHPGKYEASADMESGAWTHLKIEVKARTAKLYVAGSEKPCLVVNDLKLSRATGKLGLWIGPGTDGYFANLKIVKN